MVPVLAVGALARPTLVAGGQAFFVVVEGVIFAIWLLSHYGRAPNPG